MHTTNHTSATAPSSRMTAPAEGVKASSVTPNKKSEIWSTQPMVMAKMFPNVISWPLRFNLLRMKKLNATMTTVFAASTASEILNHSASRRSIGSASGTRPRLSHRTP